MRINLKFTIDCDADAAWRALHSPAAVAELYGPIMQLRQLSDLPPEWAPGDDTAVQMRLAGIVPMGTQLISVSDRIVKHHGEPVRILRDTGIPLTGPLSTLRVWDHQMAVSEAPGGSSKTLWRDRLVVRGRTAPALWPALWTIWQWRQARISALAPTWAFDMAEEDHTERP